MNTQSFQTPDQAADNLKTLSLQLKKDSADFFDCILISNDDDRIPWNKASLTRQSSVMSDVINSTHNQELHFPDARGDTLRDLITMLSTCSIPVRLLRNHPEFSMESFAPSVDFPNKGKLSVLLGLRPPAGLPL